MRGPLEDPEPLGTILSGSEPANRGRLPMAVIKAITGAITRI